MLVRNRNKLPIRQLLSPSSSHILSRHPATSASPLTQTHRLLTTRSELRPWSRRQPSRGLHGSERNLATAMDDYKPLDKQYDNIQNGGSPLYSSSPSYPPLYEMRPFDVSTPLTVKPPAPLPPRKRIGTNGITGDVEEMVPVFDACLAVGKLDRAALVLKRIIAHGMFNKFEVTQLNNRFLRAKLAQIQEDPGLYKAEDLHQWYELQIRGNGLPQTAETIACMLKATLLTTHGARLERLVNRYMGMVPGEAGLEVLYMDDILSDQDLATITSICPTYNLLAEEEAAALELEFDSTEIQEIEAESAEAGMNSTPEVLATPQKGMGLKVLKSQLSLFNEVPEGFDISKLSLAERKEVQARLEKDCIDSAVTRWREENENLKKMGLNTAVASATFGSRLYEWQVALEARFVEEFELIDRAEESTKKSKEDLDRCIYGPLMRQSSPSRLAAVTILSTLSSLAMHGADKGVPVSTMLSHMSKIAEEDIRTQVKNSAKDKKFASKKTAQMNVKRVLQFSPEKSASTKIKTSKKATSEEAAEPAEPVEPSHFVSEQELPQLSAAETTAGYAESAWPVNIRTKLGAAMLQALIDTAKVLVKRDHPVTGEPVSQIQPAFSHTPMLKKGKKIGMIMPNRELVELMMREPRGAYIARHLPMVVEPEPWTKFDKGGFVETSSSLVRIKSGEVDQRIYCEAAIARGDMDQVLKGLDVLGRTAWRINRPVFDVMLEAWNTGEGFASIPPISPQMPIPPEPKNREDPLEQRRWLRTVKQIENQKAGLHSQRCFMNFQLEIARAFRDQTFYFPHNVDFRGRAYPIPTYLNHMGADHVRGLLCFAKGKELGESGLRWLKVHLANVYGYDKASLTDRENFAAKNMEHIIDSVTKPLDGNKWWLKAEDPWQCLATCFELKAALDLPDPTKYVSYLPVHQDGTCNGLQHYAALGGDEWGASQVNLVPGDKPADVYSAVAKLVEEGLLKDLEENNPYAVALNGKITRKVVKQTVMTNVYGVTFEGAKKQVLKQIDAAYPNIYAESGMDPLLLASYTATKIFRALGTMFKGAHDIQHWLGEIGGRVCRALTPEQLELIAAEGRNKKTGPPTTELERQYLKPKGAASRKQTGEELVDKFKSTLIWTTPLRMPIVQPYKKSSTRTISTCLQELVLTIPDRTDPVNRRKQLQAFPPNFIHSLDASHMILSALECDERGLTFAAVHDSFWTHPCDVDVMNDVLRDAFIRIHGENVIGRLAAEFEARYRGSIYLAKMKSATEVGKKISEWKKEHKRSLRDELLLEKTRQDLLNSSDPADVEKGRAMVTPGSIYDAMADNHDLIEPDEANESTFGVIPETEQKAVSALEGTLTPKKMATAQAVLEAAKEEAEEDDDGEYRVTNPEYVNGRVVIREDCLPTKLTPKYHTDPSTERFACEVTTALKKKLPKQQATVQFWLPLTFPQIPAKGDFDVRRLKGSQYFFS